MVTFSEKVVDLYPGDHKACHEASGRPPALPTYFLVGSRSAPLFAINRITEPLQSAKPEETARERSECREGAAYFVMTVRESCDLARGTMRATLKLATLGRSRIARLVGRWPALVNWT